MEGLPVLSLLIWLPALAALGLSFVPQGQEQLVKMVALVTSLVVFGISAGLWVLFSPVIHGAWAFEEDLVWISTFNIHYHLGVDGIGMAMVLLTGLLTPLAILGSWTAIHQRVKGFFIALLLLESGMMGVFTAADLVLFYVFWEIQLLPMALLIGIWGGPNRIYAAVKFVVYTVAGSLLMFLGILYCYYIMSFHGMPTFDILTLQHYLPIYLWSTPQVVLFAAFAFSFAIKVPMFPLHTWLPDAHVQAPTAGSVILAGVLLKMGAYGFLRFAIPFFPQGAAASASVMVGLSAIAIVYGSLMCMVQDDIKKLVAYSSVAHLGFITLGLFSGSVAGAQGAVLQMVNHGISTGALFLLVGVIYERLHRRGVNSFGGLATSTPVYATIFLIVALSSIGLPGLNGFVGEYLVLVGTFQSYPVSAAVAGIGIVLAAAYMLTLYRNMFFGEITQPDCELGKLADMRPLELVTIAPLLVLIVLLGVRPALVLDKTEPAVERVIHSMNVAAQEVTHAPRAR